jgi:Recombinase
MRDRAMSHKCHYATSRHLFAHLVGEREQHRRNIDRFIRETRGDPLLQQALGLERLLNLGPRGNARARNRALDLAPTIQELQAAGCESLRAMAAGLEERGIPAPRGGKWSAVQVARLLEAAAVPFGASANAA